MQHWRQDQSGNTVYPHTNQHAIEADVFRDRHLSNANGHTVPNNSRISPAAVAQTCGMFSLCLVLSYTLIVSAADPVAARGAQLGNGIRSAVDTALSHANKQEEMQAVAHYNSRQEYLARRRPVASELHATTKRRVQASTLLSNIASVIDEETGDIDNVAVQDLFPDWKLAEHAEGSDVVLRDLVRAIAHISNSLETAEVLAKP